MRLGGKVGDKSGLYLLKIKNKHRPMIQDVNFISL